MSTEDTPGKLEKAADGGWKLTANASSLHAVFAWELEDELIVNSTAIHAVDAAGTPCNAKIVAVFANGKATPGIPGKLKKGKLSIALRVASSAPKTEGKAPSLAIAVRVTISETEQTAET